MDSLRFPRGLQAIYSQKTHLIIPCQTSDYSICHFTSLLFLPNIQNTADYVKLYLFIDCSCPVLLSPD
jgi:hypothetical protein